jgi:hypothetical protein
MGAWEEAQAHKTSKDKSKVDTPLVKKRKMGRKKDDKGS